MDELTMEEMLHLINTVEDGVLAFTDGTHPYCIPFGYVYIDGSIYLSLFPKGKKWEYFQKNKNVCFNVYSWNDEHTEWGSVVIDGTMKQIKDLDIIESVVEANMIKMKLDPTDYLEKRMKYYRKTIDNEKGLKIFEISVNNMQGKKRKSTLTKQ